MSTLVEKAQHILDEKNSKIIPENIKNDVQIFDITGTLEEGIDTSDATATENDIVENTTAYVDGVKLTGNIMNKRGHGNSVYTETKSMSDNSGTELYVYTQYEPEYSSKPNLVINDQTSVYTRVSYADIVDELNITSDMIKKDERILGVIGTYEGDTQANIVYLEPGDEIHINMEGLRNAIDTVARREGLSSKTLLYDTENKDLFTLKLMDCVNMGQPFEHSGIGLVMDGTTTHLKVYNWDSSTDTNTLQSSDYIELVSADYPTDLTIANLTYTMEFLGDYWSTDLVFTYPSNAPIIPLIDNHKVHLLAEGSCDTTEIITFDVGSSYITINKGC